MFDTDKQYDRFLIHPADLRRRQIRCRPVVARIRNLDWETVKRCNICGSDALVIIGEHDRYGTPLRTCLCRNCGLIFLMDHLTASGYAEFYSRGMYRDLIGHFKATRQTIKRLNAGQENYANRIVNLLQGYIQRREGGCLLDVGGSTGLVARRFSDEYGFRATLLDPASSEVSAAQALGVQAIRGSIETWEGNEQFDLILLCRTIEHFYDLRAALSTLRKIIKPDGLLFCDIVDYLETCRREGPPEVTTKIDHCYWLTQEASVGIFRAFGFEILTTQVTIAADQIGFLLRPVEPRPLEALAPILVDQEIRHFRVIKSNWEQLGRTAYDLPDWFHKHAYRLKKSLRQ
jgi:SAM-dependent methyltransferase